MAVTAPPLARPVQNAAAVPTASAEIRPVRQHRGKGAMACLCGGCRGGKVKHEVAERDRTAHQRSAVGDPSPATGHRLGAHRRQGAVAICCSAHQPRQVWGAGQRSGCCKSQRTPAFFPPRSRTCDPTSRNEGSGRTSGLPAGSLPGGHRRRPLLLRRVVCLLSGSGGGGGQLALCLHTPVARAASPRWPNFPYFRRARETCYPEPR